MRHDTNDRPPTDSKQARTHHLSKGMVLLSLLPSRCSACSKRYWLYQRSVGSRITVAKTASCCGGLVCVAWMDGLSDWPYRLTDSFTSWRVVWIDQCKHSATQPRTAMANLERGKASHSLAAMRKPRLAMVPSSHEVFQGGVASVPRWSGMQ